MFSNRNQSLKTIVNKHSLLWTGVGMHAGVCLLSLGNTNCVPSNIHLKKQLLHIYMNILSVFNSLKNHTI